MQAPLFSFAFSAHITTEEQQSAEALLQKIAALEKQLEWEKLRTEALNTMIDIAEKDLNIATRKKPVPNSKKSKRATWLYQLSEAVQTVGYSPHLTWLTYIFICFDAYCTFCLCALITYSLCF